MAAGSFPVGLLNELYLILINEVSQVIKGSEGIVRRNGSRHPGWGGQQQKIS